MTNTSSYVIITPAHNEEGFIEKTISSMIAQTILPSKWIIVNDGSKDRTAQIVDRYRLANNFIELVNVERKDGRSFGSKAKAFNFGLGSFKELDYSFIGNLDADISLDADYFASVLNRFEADPRLGISGGIVYTNIEGRFVTADNTLDSVAGAVQLFRKKCFEDIGGGYRVLPYGGIDAAAEITARMKGWTVRKFPELRVYEHRRTGTATSGPVATKLQEGRRFYSLGYGFLFYLARCLYRIKDNPVVLGSAVALLGYLQCMLSRQALALPPDAVAFLHSEQKRKLRRFF